MGSESGESQRGNKKAPFYRGFLFVAVGDRELLL
jgi:hypothetical protein